MQNSLYAHSSVDILSSPEKVWKLLTREETMTEIMLGMKPVTNWNKGDELRWIGRHSENPDDNARGIIEHIEPFKNFQFSFFYPGYGYPDSPEYYNIVSIVLQQEGPVTTVKVTQGDFSAFKEGETYTGHSREFWNAALQKLKQMSEENAEK